MDSGPKGWKLLNDVSTPDTVKDFRDPALPIPSFWWRLSQSLLCITGGVFFFLGSLMYFPSVDKPGKGAALFTMGATCFFIADSMELHAATKFSNPCYFGPEADELLQRSRGNSVTERAQARWGITNAFVGAVGSLLYLLGCVFFIPKLGRELVGDVLFIPGSIVILLSEVWRIYRAGTTTPTDADSGDNGYFEVGEQNNTAAFSIANLQRANRAELCGDIALGLGACAFLVGSCFFLPKYDTSDLVTEEGVYAFLIGSVLFIATGVCVFVKHFFTAPVGNGRSDGTTM